MKMLEMRQRTDEELVRLASQLQEDLYALRVKKTTNQLDNTVSLREARRSLARVETLQRARQLEIEGSKSE